MINELKIPYIDSIIDQTGIVIRWPKKKEEKLYVLKYLQSKFQKNKIYSEIEINLILKKWHSFNDHALLRRELYNNYLLNRSTDCKSYWI